MDGLSGCPVPDERRLALVGDADRGDRVPADAGRLEGALERAADALPDFFGFVLDPAWHRVMLGELAGGAPERAALDVHDENRASGRPLIDGEKVSRHGWPPVS